MMLEGRDVQEAEGSENMVRYRRTEWMRRKKWRATSSKSGRSLIIASLELPCRRFVDDMRSSAFFPPTAGSFSTGSRLSVGGLNG